MTPEHPEGPARDPLGTVRIHPDDDPASPAARRKVKLPITREPGAYWRDLTPAMGTPPHVYSDEAICDWPVQELADVASALGHSSAVQPEVERLTAEVQTQNRLYRKVGAERDEKQFELERVRRLLDRMAVALGIRKGLPAERIWVWVKASGDMVREAERERDEWKQAAGAEADLLDQANAEVSRLREQLAAQQPNLPHHNVVLSSEDVKADRWEGYCHDCRKTFAGSMAGVRDWRDQHEADTLRPQLQANSKFEPNLGEGRPSGSERLVPHSGAELIAAERTRQVAVEGWTPEHDAEHDNDDLAMAAACYSLPASMREMRRWNDDLGALVPMLWPWHPEYWKSTGDDRIRDLVKAGALIAAEIDRIQAQDAAQAARSEATLRSVAVGATVQRYTCSEHIWDEIPCPNCEPRFLASPSLRKEGEDT